MTAPTAVSRGRFDSTLQEGLQSAAFIFANMAVPSASEKFLIRCRRDMWGRWTATGWCCEFSSAPTRSDHSRCSVETRRCYFVACKAVIRKLPSGEYRLYSRKKNPKTGKRRNLGTFKTRAAAEKHERAVQFFKHRG